MTHHVRRANFRLKTRKHELAQDDRQRWQSWFEASFSELLDTVLEEWIKEHAYRHDDQTIDIRRLHFDLGFLQLSDPMNQLYPSVRRQLFEQLSDHQPRLITADVSLFENYTHFLRHGTWKLRTANTQWQSIETWFLENPKSFNKIYQLLGRNPIQSPIWSRFFLQHSVEFIDRFVSDCVNVEILNKLDKNGFIRSLPYRPRAFLLCYTANTFNDTFKALEDWLEMNIVNIELHWSQKPEYLQVRRLQDWIADSASVTGEAAGDNNENSAEVLSPLVDSQLVEHAGIVLLHPFLQSFFTKFDWLDESGVVKKEQQSLALFSLLYMATGRESAVEPELLLFKVLLGVPIDQPIANEIPLTPAVKEECRVLLQAVIKHWSALKNTSIDGLRQGFLQRAGSLFFDDDGNRLHIEKKSMDILLNRLPWSISLLNFPWMKKPLFVDWAG